MCAVCTETEYVTQVYIKWERDEVKKEIENFKSNGLSKEQLLEIFNPKYDFFKNNPDAFWTCMIALFTGARMNAAITLQYKDIFTKDGYIMFMKKTYPVFIKKLDIKLIKTG